MKNTLLIIILCCNCATIKKGMDYNHYVLYNETRAVKVISEDKRKYLTTNFQGTKQYYLKKKYADFSINDTISLIKCPELICRLKRVNKK